MHEHSKMCDRELLILGVYLKFQKTQRVFFGDGSKEDVACESSFRFPAQNMFPEHIDFEKQVPETAKILIERREFFGNLLRLTARQGRSVSFATCPRVRFSVTISNTCHNQEVPWSPCWIGHS